jgi:hypothetical protein
LTNATAGKPKGKLTWTAAMLDSFQAAKEALAAAVPLHFPDPDAHLSLAVDASGTHMGGRLAATAGQQLAAVVIFFEKTICNGATLFSF